MYESRSTYVLEKMVALPLLSPSVMPKLQCGNVIGVTTASTLLLSQLLSLPSPVNPTVSVVAADTAAKRHCL